MESLLPAIFLTLLFILLRLRGILYITSLVWDATLAFILLIFVSIILDKISFFEAVAL